MSRPRKWRYVSQLPSHNQYGPIGCECRDKPIIMHLDEYETIRLIDLENLTQLETAERMQVARTTVQAIYQRARRKLAKSLINNRLIIIDDGEYQKHKRVDCKSKYRHRPR